MRIYQDPFEMYSEEKRNLHEMGIVVRPKTMQDKTVAGDPAYETLEVSPAVFSILDGSERDVWLQERGGNLNWAYREFAERVAGFFAGYGTNPGDAWRYRANVWQEYLHDGRFAYTYSERLAPQLSRVVDRLRDDPDTRQAVMPVYSAADVDYLGGVRRVPCSMHYQFLIREDALEAIYVMRSSDFATHFIYDIWMALELQTWMAQRVTEGRAEGVFPGKLTFFSGSLHLYRRDAEEGVF